MNILRDGIILAVYLFIIMSTYMFTSEPFSDVMDSLSGLDAASDTETQDTFSLVDTVYAMMFIILAGIPSIWFIARVFQRDPTWGYYR